MKIIPSCPALATLGLLIATELAAHSMHAEDIRYPAVASVVDVTQPPYYARGDGATDDTDALQQALDEVMGQHNILYLPNGTYRIHRTLQWKNKDSKGGNAWGFVTIQGQSRAKTILRLTDGTFPDGAHPMMWCGGFGSADWFHNSIQNLTFDLGRENPGGVGLNFYSNNTGAIRDVDIVSRDGKGRVGLELGNDMNGPLLVRNLTVKGFAVGVHCASSVNSQTFEHIHLAGQSSYGFSVEGQSVAIRGLTSENSVTALRVASFTTLLDARLQGTGAANGIPAIYVTGGAFFARDVHATGYARAISDSSLMAPAALSVGEFVLGKPTSPFGGPSRSLNLPVKETPDIPIDDPKRWAIVATAADAQSDSADAAQRAIDSGATTVFIPTFCSFHRPVIVRGKVQRVLGTGAWVDYLSHSKPDFIIADGESPVVSIENMAPINGGIEIATRRTVALKSVETSKLVCGKNGDLFLEDFCSNDLRFLPGQRVWARQLNVENEGDHLTNDGGSLWVLGYKTERGGALVHTKNRGATEIFGTFSYTTTAPTLGPMFRTVDASVFAYFNEVSYSRPFATLIAETQGGETRTIARGEGGTVPYVTRATTR